MKVFTIRSLIFILQAFLVFLSPAAAHHATAADYDIAKTVKIAGAIAKVNWANPHIHIQLDVKVGAAAEAWDVELGSVGAAVVAGMQKEMLKAGVPIAVKGYPGKNNGRKDAQRTLCAVEVTFPDGLVATFVVGV
jgi:hypothetical protein